MSDQIIKLVVTGDGKSAVVMSKDVKAALTDMGTAGASSGKQAAAGLGSAKVATDALGASMKSFTAQRSAVEQMLGTQAKSLADVAAKQTAYRAALHAGVLDQDEYTSAAKALEGQARKLFDAFAKSTPVIKDAAAATHTLTLNSGAAQRELGVLLSELLRGNFAAFQRSVITLGRQVGILNLLFSSTGLIVAGFIAVFAGTIALITRAESELSDYNKVLALTGGTAKLSASELHDAAQEIGAATGRYGDAREALTSLAASGRLSGDSLKVATQAAVDYSTLSGASIEKATKLVEGFLDKPYEAAVKLNEQYSFLSAAQADEIRQLEDTGHTADASALAIAAFGAAMTDKRAEWESTLTGLAKLWHGVESGIESAASKLGTFLDTQVRKMQAFTPSQALLALFGGAGAVGGMLGTTPNPPQQHGSTNFSNTVTEGDEETVKATAKARELTLALKEQSETYKATAVAIVEHNRAKALSTVVSQQAKDAVNAEFDSQLKYARALDATREASKHHTDIAGVMNHVMSDLDSTIEAGVVTAGKLADVYGSPLQRATTTYEANLKSLGQAMDALEAKNAITKGGLPGFATLWQTLSDAAAEAGDQFDETSDQIEHDSHIVDNILDQMDLENTARSKSTAAVKAETLVRQALAKAKQQNITLDDNEIDRLRDGAKVRAEISEGLDIASNLESPFDKLISQIGRIKDALKEVQDPMSKAFDPKLVEPLTKALDHENKQLDERNNTLMQEGVSSLQKFAKEGTVAYTALGIAQDILAYKSAIAAIANQGSGDPYSAFARIAAMIALMASIGIRVGGGGSSGGDSGPSPDSAEVRQASQGTGSVLGDASAKSESIAKAIEITASAATALVGINRGMLDALTALQNALGAAGNQLAHGAGDAQFSPVTTDAGFLSSVFGGDQSIIDGGIVIAGGALNDMLNKIVVGAYQTVQTDGGWFGSDSTSDQLVDVSDQFGKQFQLVIKSIADTVRAGALALGLLPADVDAAMASFKVESTRISLEGLSAEDQQKEIEAAFSKIFDGLAGAVVPFIGQFQQVGEGLGETLVRVATEVQVSQDAFKQLGLAVDETDPEKFAQIADGLVTAAGGLDKFIAEMQTFTQNFAPAGQQLKTSGDALTSAFEQAGLTLPKTRDGMWALMQSLDATTEEGRKQIAVLLSLADASGAYYDALEKQTQAIADYANFIVDLAKQADTAGLVSGFDAARLSIQAWEQQTIKQANDLAQAAGLQGAAESTLTMIHSIAAQKIAQAIETLRKETLSLAAQLGYITGSTDAANDALGNFGTNMGAQIGRVADASDNLYQRQLDGIKSINDYLTQMQFGDLSGLTPEQQLDAARAQLLQTQQLALGGDADAMSALPQMAQTFLQLLRDQQTSGADFNQGAEFVRQLLQAVVDQGPTVAAPDEQPVGGLTHADLQAHDDQLIRSEDQYRGDLALQLAQHLRDLSEALQVPVLELAAQMGVPLMQLATDLGVNLTNITGASVEALSNMALQLGIPLGDLVTALGLHLPDLAAGVRELATNLGIDLTSLTATTAGQIADLAGSLGTNLRTLTTALGIDLGELTDVNSPVFQALQTKVGDIGGDTSTELQPYLDAIKNATSDEDKNLAVKALRDHVDQMAPDIKNLLAPYFDDIAPADTADQLTYLSNVADSTHSMATDMNAARLLLGDIKEYLAVGLHHDGVPGYAVGSAYIANDHLAMVHQGEGIVDAASWRVLQKYGIRVGSSASNDDTQAVVVELRAVREELAALRKENATGHSAVAGAVCATGREAKTQRADLARNKVGTGRSDRYGN